MGMKEFYQIVEGKIKDDHSDELDKINSFAAAFDALSYNFDQVREKEYAKLAEELSTA